MTIALAPALRVVIGALLGLLGGGGSTTPRLTQLRPAARVASVWICHAVSSPPFAPLQLLYNNTAVVIGIVYVYLPFMVLPMYASLERLDRAYLEASLDLGAGQWRTFFSIVVPLARPGIISLQGHDPTTDLSFRNIWIAEMPGQRP